MKHIVFLGGYSDEKMVFKTAEKARAFIGGLNWTGVAVMRDRANNVTTYKRI